MLIKTIEETGIIMREIKDLEDQVSNKLQDPAYRADVIK